MVKAPFDLDDINAKCLKLTLYKTVTLFIHFLQLVFTQPEFCRLHYVHPECIHLCKVIRLEPLLSPFTHVFQLNFQDCVCSMVKKPFKGTQGS